MRKNILVLFYKELKVNTKLIRCTAGDTVNAVRLQAEIVTRIW
jgi:acyl CoA:acetate/3-ketoacid CoA transferase